MSKTMKTILLALGILLVIVVGVFVVYKAQQPSLTPSPTPRPTAQPSPSVEAVTPEVFVVGGNQNACELSFTVSPELTPGLNCVDKVLYKDVDANTPGTYDLSAANLLSSSFELVPGDTYVYVINYENTGTGAVGGEIVDTLPDDVEYVDSSDGCTYDSADHAVSCALTSVAAAGSGKVAIRFIVNSSIAEDSITNAAILLPESGQSSTCQLTSPIYASTPPSAPPSAELNCVAKRAYEDSTTNTLGNYYLNNEIEDTNTLQDGQIVVFNIVIRNDGGTAVPDTEITDVLSSNLTYIDGESGCTYDSSSRTVTCDVGDLAAGTETSRSFRAKIVTANLTAIANTADVASSNGQRDSCSITINANGVVVSQPSPTPTSLPEAGVFAVTTRTLGIGLLFLIIGMIGLLLI